MGFRSVLPPFHVHCRLFRYRTAVFPFSITAALPGNMPLVGGVREVWQISYKNFGAGASEGGGPNSVKIKNLATDHISTSAYTVGVYRGAIFPNTTLDGFEIGADQARSITRLTVVAFHCPPRGESLPAVFRLSAMD